jgi:nucleotide-binding universal stress UspA family protein
MNVLVASDGSPASEAAVRLLAALARRGAVRFRVFTVASFDLALALAEQTGRYDEAAALERARAIAEVAAASLRDAGHDASAEVVEGHPATEILAAAERADLVAVGAGRERWLEILLLGSTAHEVLLHAPCPVLVVHRTARDRGIQVLVATDGSEAADRAARTFAELADPGSCTIRVVSVHRPEGIPVPAAVQRGDALAAPEARSAAERTAAILRGSGFSVEVGLLAGPPASALLSEARAVGADVVVVGARGLGGLRRAIGSVSDKLARHAPATLVGR